MFEQGDVVMYKVVRSVLIAASVASIYPAAAEAKTPLASSLWSGTWQLNTVKSKFSAPVGKRSETRVYTVNGNKLSVKARGTDDSGKPMSYSYSGAFDGKPHKMVGNPVGDTIALTLRSPLSANATVRMGRTVTASAKSDISPDGKHLTLARTTLHGKAAPTREVLVFDRK